VKIIKDWLVVKASEQYSGLVTCKSYWKSFRTNYL